MIKSTRNNSTRTNISPVPGINREADFKRLAVVYSYITDVPWDEDESEAFEGDAELLRQTVENGLNRRGETVVHIPYDSNYWKIKGVSFNLKRFSGDLYHKGRKFILYQIIKRDWRSLETIRGYIRHISRFFEEYREATPNALPNYIHSSEIIDFVENMNTTIGVKYAILVDLVEFYRFLGKNYRKEYFSVRINELEEYLKEIRYVLKRTRAPKRYPSIPDAVFYEMHFIMLALIRAPMTPFDEAVMAAAILLFMWTGLRPKEIRGLRRHCLVKREIDGKELTFYEYSSPKNKNAVKTIFLFPAALEAFKVLERLQSRRENVFITDYLVSFWDYQTNEPLSADMLNGRYNALLCKYMGKYLSIPMKGLTRCTKQGLSIYRPSFYCFRVHLCTYLIDHNLDERWVEAHLGHLSATMRGRYYRMKEWRKESVRQRINKHLHMGQIADEIRRDIESKRLSPEPEGQERNEQMPVAHALEKQLIKDLLKQHQK